MSEWNLHLRYIHHGDFRTNEASMRETALKECERYGINPGPRDTILLVSANGKIVYFVFGFKESPTLNKKGVATGKTTTVLPALKYRILDGGTFNEYMIAEYASALGINLDRIQRLSEHLARLDKERSRRRRPAPQQRSPLREGRAA